MAEFLGVMTSIILVLVILYISFSCLLEKFGRNRFLFKIIHESGICIGIGIIVGLTYKLITGEHTTKFESSFFFYFMLPFLTFGIGFNIKRRRFFRYTHQIIL